VKKKWKGLAVISLLLIAVVGLGLLFLHRATQLKSFDMNDFQTEIESYPSEKRVGAIADVEDAIAKANELWVDEYSEKGYGGSFVKEPLVFYDEPNDCWHLHGKYNINTLGGVPHALIRGDGTVLASWWHEYIGDVDINEYQHYIRVFPSNKNVGSTADVDALVDKAIALWTEEFGEQDYKDGLGIVVFFDEKNRCWLIRTRPPLLTFGGAYDVIIHEDGRVIAAWPEE
jgi:hypothetical protein